MRVLVFGASVTQGFWDTEGGWVQRLREYYDTLQVKDWSKDQPTLFNLGISGDGTAQLLKRVENETIARQLPNEDLSFVISIGINDSFTRSDGSINITPAQYYENLTQIVKIVKNFSDKVLLLGLQSCDESRTTPVSWAQIHYTNNRIQHFDTEMRKVAKVQAVSYTPIFDEFKQNQDLFSDGLHPNNNGHQLIFELVRPVLDELLNT